MAEALSIGAARTQSSTPAATARHTSTLVVENMHCGGCMRKVEAALTRLPGVTSARVNLSSRRVVFETTAPPSSLEPYVRALAAAGFTAYKLAVRSADEEARRDRDLLRRLGVAGFAAANVMLLSVSVWAGIASDMPASLQTAFHWLSALIAIPAIAYAGQPFFASARQALAGWRLNMDVPISLGVVLATAMSLFQTIRGTEQVYFDAAITLLFFLLAGRTLDQAMRRRAESAAENLLGLRASEATVIAASGAPERVAIEAVRPGMRLLIASGERVPVEARLVAGASEIDESLITGESRPRKVLEGDRLHAGTINMGRPIEAAALSGAEDTLLDDIARLMRGAEQAKSRYVRLADRAAKVYSPAVHVLGLATFIGWMALGLGWEPALTAAIAVLIITCPCALALAVPVVQVVATGRLFRGGVILKAADGLERLAEVDTVVLDKTGTLTLGEPALVAPETVPDAALAMAAALAARSRHPYALAVVRAARARGLAVLPAADVVETPGAGLAAEIAGRIVRLGSARHVGLEGGGSTVPGEQVADRADQNADAEATLWLRVAGEPPVAFRFDDPMREDARRVIAELGRRGLAVEVLSGDRAAAVAEAAETAGIARWAAGQRPDEKLRHLGRLRAAGRRVLMVGDGLNDAPALAAGHASLSPSTAADVSQSAADAVFQGTRLAPIVELLDVARKVRRLSLENFAIAIGYNLVFVPLAMAGRVTPLIAAIAMSASSIAVTANALRLYRAGAQKGANP